ncbi:TPA: O-acetyl-ADP-ribose deacetylase [Kluyvera georgiana]|uniref:O-acetyl-ADP-ribose deacetylase n=1 Tax=Kluyvera georgiana ATCC 51603 TaxID=1354264 RepID=A0A1B7JBR3_9ENTR|nr:O-acetyl-ADP-ribose deacetylase [Kluyvera georgiana]OAT45255.1 putative ADP-ribose binding protein [Kluyvera georgiana ATCC 51603]
MTERIQVLQGDITRFEVDVIVNAANPSLMGGGGVDGAIHRAAGPSLQEACAVVRQQQGTCPTGHAVITHAGNLKAKAVIHTVGPVWQGGGEQEASLLQQAYHNSLQLALDNGYRTLAFPAISTGAYGYPHREAAEIAISTVAAFLTRRSLPEIVFFVCFDDETTRLYQEILGQTRVPALANDANT